MEIYQKITKLRKDKKLKISDLHNRLRELFGDKTLSYRTLLRIEKGHTDGRSSSLEQICMGLGVSLRELREGTQEEFTIADFIKKHEREGRYVYNEKAAAEILTGAKRKFLALELVLEKGAKTKIEKDPETPEGFEKWIYVLMGRIDCIVRNVRFSLKKGDSISFNSSLPHYFENNSPQRSRCIIVQNPRHI